MQNYFLLKRQHIIRIYTRTMQVLSLYKEKNIIVTEEKSDIMLNINIIDT